MSQELMRALKIEVLRVKPRAFKGDDNIGQEDLLDRQINKRNIF